MARLSRRSDGTAPAQTVDSADAGAEAASHAQDTPSASADLHAEQRRAARDALLVAEAADRGDELSHNKSDGRGGGGGGGPGGPPQLGGAQPGGHYGAPAPSQGFGYPPPQSHHHPHYYPPPHPQHGGWYQGYAGGAPPPGQVPPMGGPVSPSHGHPPPPHFQQYRPQPMAHGQQGHPPQDGIEGGSGLSVSTQSKDGKKSDEQETARAILTLGKGNDGEEGKEGGGGVGDATAKEGQGQQQQIPPPGSSPHIGDMPPPHAHQQYGPYPGYGMPPPAGSPTGGAGPPMPGADHGVYGGWYGHHYGYGPHGPSPRDSSPGGGGEGGGASPRGGNIPPLPSPAGGYPPPPPHQQYGAPPPHYGHHYYPPPPGHYGGIATPGAWQHPAGPEGHFFPGGVASPRHLGVPPMGAPGGTPPKVGHPPADDKAGRSAIGARTTSSAKPARAEKTRRNKAGNKVVKRRTEPNQPRRPLSGYNIFFSEERARILAKLPDKDSKKEGKDATDNATGGKDAAAAATETENPVGCADPSKPTAGPRPYKRRHRKSHGKIGFRDLARQIGAAWRGLPKDELARYKKLAEKDMKRYREEMLRWNSSGGALKKGDGSATADNTV